MQTIKGIYDGVNFKPTQPIPVTENYNIFITFVEPLEKNQKDILKFAGIWKDDDVIDLDTIISERNNFSSGRMKN